MGLSAVNAVLGALVHRGNSGRGQSIEVPMFETMVELVMADHSSGAGFDPPLGPPGYLRSLSPERYPFETKDGFICAMIYTTQQWSNFFDLTGGEMRNDERFASLTSRTVHASFVHQHLQSVLRAQTTVEWLNEFETRDIPAAILHTLDSLPHDPHLVATGFFEWREHHTEGKVRHTRPPSTWSETPLGIWRDAPNVGEHSEEILREIGLKDESIAQMMNNGSTCSPARRAQMLDQDAGQAASRRRNAN